MIIRPEVRRSSRFTAMTQVGQRGRKRANLLVVNCSHCKPSGNQIPAGGSPRERDKNNALSREQAKSKAHSDRPLELGTV